MENNLIQQAKLYFTDEVISTLSTHVGENPDIVRKGVDVAIPSLLLGYHSHVGDGLDSLLNQSRHLFSKFKVGQVFGNYFGSHQGTDNTQFESDNLLAEIFGDKLQGVITTSATLLGIKADSVKQIFGAVIPTIISVITRKGGNWGTADIRQELIAHKNEFASALPAGMGLGTFGSSFAQAEAPMEIDLPKGDPALQVTPEPPIVHTEQTVTQQRRRAGVWWILVPLLLLLLWVFLGRGCNTNSIVTEGDTVSVNLQLLWNR